MSKGLTNRDYIQYVGIFSTLHFMMKASISPKPPERGLKNAVTILCPKFGQ